MLEFFWFCNLIFLFESVDEREGKNKVWGFNLILDVSGINEDEGSVIVVVVVSVIIIYFVN